MKARELRIGNWVKYYDGKHEGEILGIRASVFSKNGKVSVSIEPPEDAGWLEANIDDISPILLTEKWLLKFGFVGRKDFKWNGIVGMQFRDEKYYLALKDLSNVLFHSVVEFKYVHQLQNLYFALTGEELIIKL